MLDLHDSEGEPGEESVMGKLHSKKAGIRIDRALTQLGTWICLWCLVMEVLQALPTGSVSSGKVWHVCKALPQLALAMLVLLSLRVKVIRSEKLPFEMCINSAIDLGMLCTTGRSLGLPASGTTSFP